MSDFENHDFIIHIYNEYGRLMYYIAHQMLPDRQQCEDVIQESLTNLIAKVDILEASNPVHKPLLGHRCRSSQEITGSPTPFSTSNHYLWICASASFSLSNPNIAA